MDDLPGFEALGHPEDQVPVLAPLVAEAVPPGGDDQIAAEEQEMGEVVLAQQKKGIEIGLEVGELPAAPVVDLVLIAVDDAGLRVLVRRQHGQGKRVLGQQVVVIERRTHVPDAISRAVLEAAEMWPFSDRVVTLMRGSRSA